jgi:xylan 1,4-beta-xylosidase
MYSSYTAASFARKYELAERHGIRLEGALTWAFEFENTPYFAGFRALATNGIVLPVFNVFRMFSRMATERIAVTSDHAVDLDTLLKRGVRERPDVAALASRDGRSATIMAWHYHDDDVAGPAAQVSLLVEGLGTAPGPARLQHYRIDADHSNAYTVWQRMGSPQSPSPEQYEQLERASELASLSGPSNIDIENGRATMAVTLPRQAVSLLILEW